MRLWVLTLCIIFGSDAWAQKQASCLQRAARDQGFFAINGVWISGINFRLVPEYVKALPVTVLEDAHRWIDAGLAGHRSANPHFGKLLKPALERFLTGDPIQDRKFIDYWVKLYRELEGHLTNTEMVGDLRLGALSEITPTGRPGEFLHAILGLEEMAWRLDEKGISYQLVESPSHDLPVISFTGSGGNVLDKKIETLLRRSRLNSLVYDPFEIGSFVGMYADEQGKIFVDIATVQKRDLSSHLKHELDHYVIDRNLNRRLENPYYGSWLGFDGKFKIHDAYAIEGSFSESHAYRTSTAAQAREILKNPERVSRSGVLNLAEDVKIIEAVSAISSRVEKAVSEAKFERGKATILWEEGRSLELRFVIGDPPLRDTKGNPIIVAQIGNRATASFQFPLVKSLGPNDPKNFFYLQELLRAQARAVADDAKWAKQIFENVRAVLAASQQPSHLGEAQKRLKETLDLPPSRWRR